MQTDFTPLASLAGGALIGLAAVLLMLTGGRVFGATGLLGGLVLPASRGDFAWRAAVVAGMVSAPLAWRAVTGGMPDIAVPTGPAGLVLGGLIVGFGATLGAGCPSGHGVCGIAQLSPRSVVATAVFMATAAVTVFVVRHVAG